MAVEYLDNGNVDGTCLGQSSSTKIGFYGTTPVDQAATASEAAVTQTALSAIATCTFSAAYTGMWAFASSTVAKTIPARLNQCVTDITALTVLVNQLRTDLVACGLIKGSA